MQMLDIITGGDKEKLKAIKTKLESVKARVIRYSAKVISDQATAKAASTPKKGSVGHGEIKGMTIFRNPPRFLFDSCLIISKLSPTNIDTTAGIRNSTTDGS